MEDNLSLEDILIPNDEGKIEIKENFNVEEQPQIEENKSETLKNYYETLVEYKLLIPQEGEQFDGSEESISKAKENTIKYYKDQVYNEILNSLTPEFKAALEYGYNGGRSFDDFVKVFANSIDYDSVNIEDENNQKDILRNYFSNTTKYNKDKIEKMISRLEEVNSLREEAEDALTWLQENQERQKQDLIKEQQLKEVQRLNQEKEIRQNIQNIIDTDPAIVQDRKGKIKAFLFNPIQKDNVVATDYQRVLSSISSNYKHLVQLADILSDYNSSTGFDFSRFKKLGKTEAVSDLHKTLEQKINSKTKLSQTSQTQNSNVLPWDDIFSNL